MATVIAIVNQKGGVGKTTTTANIGVALAELGKRILFLDLDAQAHLSLGFGVEIQEGQPSIYNLLFDESLPLDSVIRRNVHPNADLLPADINLSAADLQLISEMNRERVLARRLAHWTDQYDFVLIDNSPSLSLLVINSLTAANYALVPVQCAFWALRGMKQLFATVDKIKSADLNPKLKVLGILPTMFDARTSISNQVMERLREGFGGTVFETTIKKTVQFDYAAVAQQPLLVHTKDSEAADAYRAVAKEVLIRVKKA